MQDVQFADTTLGDAQQTLWGACMDDDMLLPYVAHMDDIGFRSIEMMNATVFEQCVRVLEEDPWERMRQCAGQAVRTPLGVRTRGQYLFGGRPLADDVVAAGVERLAANGIRRHLCYDPLNDLRMLEASIEASRRHGLRICGGLVYSRSPVHTHEYYAGKAAELAAREVDSVCLLDPCGVLRPEAVRDLVPRLVDALGDGVALEISAHCRSGRTEIVYLEAARLGARVLHTATTPLAGAMSLPPTEYFVEHLGRQGARMQPRPEPLERMADYFAACAEARGLPLGEHRLHDPDVDRAEIPCSFVARFRELVRRHHLEEATVEVTHEINRLREDLGYPTMAMPVAEAVCTQALLNVRRGKRNETLTGEIAQYAAGRRGRPPAPPEPGLMRRAREPGRDAESGAAASLPPTVDEIRRRSGLDDGDDLVLAALFESETLAPLFEARERRHREGRTVRRAGTPLEELIAEVERRSSVRWIRVRKGGFRFERGSLRGRIHGHREGSALGVEPTQSTDEREAARDRS